jgi:hypothetical protein
VHRIRGKLTYSNVVATIALFLALAGGTAFAATEMLPKNSVGAKQIKKGAITPAKLAPTAKSKLTGPRGATGATGAQGPKGEKGDPGIAGSAIAYAKVEAAGEIVAAESKNMAGAVVTNPQAGHYCFLDLPFTPHNMVATPQSALTSLNGILGAFGGCPASTEVTVEIWKTSATEEVDSPFMIMFN